MKSLGKYETSPSRKSMSRSSAHATVFIFSVFGVKAHILGILEIRSWVSGGRSGWLVHPNGAKRFFWNVLSGVWAQAGCEWRPLFPIDLRSWQVARSQCEVGSRRTKEGPHRLRGAGWERQRGGLSPRLHCCCVLSSRSAPHTYISGCLSQWEQRGGVVSRMNDRWRVHSRAADDCKLQRAAALIWIFSFLFLFLFWGEEDVSNLTG